MKGKRLMVKRVTKTEFETDDGRVFEHPIELDEEISVEEFQGILDYWSQIFKEQGIE